MASCTARTGFRAREASIDGLVDGRRRLDRLAVGPHSLIPGFAKQLVSLLQHRLGLARISADCAARMLVIARAFPSSFSRAFLSPPERGVG